MALKEIGAIGVTATMLHGKIQTWGLGEYATRQNLNITDTSK